MSSPTMHSLAPAIPDLPPSESIPPLREGDRLTRAEFERRYHAMPHINKAELLDGVVYMPSPVSFNHGGPHFNFIGWTSFFSFSTPGVMGVDDGTLRLGLDSEPQPDAFLFILPSHGGRAVLSADGYVEGEVDLIGEIAVSSVPIDLGVKLALYRRNGVSEYIVWRVLDRAIDWFILRDGQYDRLTPGPDGIYRSSALPGLWLDAAALIDGNLPRVREIALQGVASAEHAEFVNRLKLAGAGGE